MKTASATLIQMLEDSSSLNPFSQADLLIFLLVGGGTIRLTNLDVNVAIGADTYLATGPAVETIDNATRIHWKVGLDVDTMVVEITPRALDVISGAAYPDKIGSQPYLSAIRAGILDGAHFQLWRAYWPGGFPTPYNNVITPGPAGYPTPIDYVIQGLFFGRVVECDISRRSAIVTINSQLEQLTTLMPHNLFQAGCTHTLYDAGCTLLAANFKRSGSISSVGNPANLLTSAVAAPPGSGTYNLGRMTMTSGGNIGLSRGIRSWNSGTGVFTLIAPFPFTVQPADTFDAFAGCDKQLRTCQLFANTANFDGTPFIPYPETAI